MGIVTFQSSSAPQLPTNMKFLVLAACVAVSSAQGFFGLQAHPNGAITPIDEPAVAAARADHLATKFGAGGYVAGVGAGLGYAGYGAGLGYAGVAPGYAAGYGYAGPLNLNTQLIAHPNGAVVPLDEPAVAAARADHLASKGIAYAAAAPVFAAAPLIASAPVAASAPYAAVGYGYAGPLNLNTQLIAHPNGAVVPVDEPAVAAARADHLATKGVYGGVY